ncbi:MAG: VCBS repeat-containing protein [Kofleriaceae bacterium]
MTPHTVRAIALAAVATLSACFEDRYHCASDADCNLVAGGRCAPDGLCTEYDGDCPTERRYTAHAGDRSATCFDDRIALEPVRGGQPPALERIAQPRSAPSCPHAARPVGPRPACARRRSRAISRDTEIAITAIRSVTDRALWRLKWVDGAWTAVASEHTVFHAWLAPAPGEVEPRLAGLLNNGDTLVVGDRTYPLGAGHAYASLTSVDLERSGRDTVVLSYELAPPDTSMAIVVDLGSHTLREIPVTASEHLVWGDEDRDGFPDALAGSNNRYTILSNFDDDNHERSLASATSNTVPAGPPALRGFDWLDLDGDRRLDLVVFGNAMQLHTGVARIQDTPTLKFDCDPPRRDPAGCMGDDISYAGAALPSPGDPALVVTGLVKRSGAPLEGHGPWRVGKVAGLMTVAPIPYVAPCLACNPLIAVVTRDLDGDGELDIVAFDNRLGVYTALSSAGRVLLPSHPIPDSGDEFTTVDTSVSGRPRVSP